MVFVMMIRRKSAAVCGCTFKKIAVAKWTVWALNDKGELYTRKGISSFNPRGSVWSKVSNNGNNAFLFKYLSISLRKSYVN